MTCTFCKHSEKAHKEKMKLSPGEKWRCPKCYTRWIADLQGVWTE